MKRTSFARLLAMIGLLLVTGCSSFHRDWDRAVAASVPATTLEGPWDGHWKSNRNGHTGRLRCLLTKQSEGTYEARFHARFWKIFSYRYRVPLQVQEQDDRFTFQGTSDLGWWAGGNYTAEGTATPQQFDATYRSKWDHGYFRLNRP